MSELGTAERGAEAKAPLPDRVSEAPDTGHEPEAPEEPEAPDGPEQPDDLVEPEEPGEPELERAFLGDAFSKLRDTLVGPREPAEGPVDRYAVVERPDFNAMKIPDFDVSLFEYGKPLERPDGQRTPLFDGSPRREQTEQGKLGDCGVIATMGAVATHFPEAISECVKENEDGTYEVTLHQVEKKYSGGLTQCEPNGAVTVLTITPDLVVQYDQPGKPAYGRAGAEPVAWPSVLEKAFAGVDQTWEEDLSDKASGYERLDKGTRPSHRAEMLTQLTGRPAYTEDIPTQYDMNGVSPDRQLLSMFREKLDAGCPILIGTRKIGKDEGPLPKGLVDGHVYEVTGVDERGLIQLRNPHNLNHPTLTAKELRANSRPDFTTMG